MKQIKVTDTRMHQTHPYPLMSERGFKETTIPVADAELVLVECKPIEAKLIELYGRIQLYNHSVIYEGLNNRYLKPILISRTEKIEEGDWDIEYCDIDEKWLTPRQVSNDTWDMVSKANYCRERGTNFKILALPEHFSPKHLQAIVEGKLKEGKVLVECCYDENIPEPYNCEIIKFNPLTIYPNSSVDIKELGRQRAIDRMWNPDSLETRRVANEIISAVEYGFKIGQSIYPIEEKMYTREEVREIIKSYAKYVWYNNDEDTKEWFEQNVK